MKPRPEIPYYDPAFINAVVNMEVRDVLVWTENRDRFSELIDKLRYLRRKHVGKYWRALVHKDFLYVVRVE